MKKVFVIILSAFVFNFAHSQINNLQDESQYLLSLQLLTAQSFTEHYSINDWEEPWRQYFEFDPKSMNLVFYKTPYDEAEKSKLPTNIQWLAKFVIPLFEVDTLIGNSVKNTITIKMKNGNPSIQAYHINSGGENKYYPAAKAKAIIIQSDKLLKIRNLDKRLNWHISELQNFHKKKMNLVNYLNQKLKQEAEYQIKDSINYRDDKKFKVIQDFQLDSSGQWLSVIVERKNIYGNPITEKQSVMIRDILSVGKDITIMLVSNPSSVLKTTTVKNKEAGERKIETVDSWFYLHFSHKKDNEKTGDEIINLFKQLGQNLKKSAWYD